MCHCVIAAVLILCRNVAPVLQWHGLWTQMAIPRWWSGKSNCYLTFISQLLIFSYEIQLKSYVITYTDSSMNSFLFLILCLWMWSPTRFLVAFYLCACLCIHVWVCEHERALYPRSEDGTWCPGDRMRPSFKLPNESARPATLVCLHECDVLFAVEPSSSPQIFFWFRRICPLQIDAVYLICDVEKT